MTTKNYGIAAVGGDLQYGKRGGRIVFDNGSDTFKITGTDGATVTRVKVADAVDADDSVALGQVQGLTGDLTTLTTTQTSLVDAINEVDGEIDTIEASAGLETDGTYGANTGTSYLDGATSLKGADTLLDTAIGNVQSELDDTQTGAGLGIDGSYSADAGTNYLKSADFSAADGGLGITESLFNADVLLDAQIKQVADDLAALGTGSITDLQTEVDNIESGAGLNADGTYTAHTTSNYINAATNLKAADLALDTQIKANADKIGSAALTVGTDLSNAVNVLDSEIGSDVLTVGTSISNAINVLDSEIGNLSNLDANITGNGDLVSAINELQGDITALGTMADQDADSVAITGGAIDGTVIGGTAAAAGTFTNVTINGDLTVTGTTTTLDVTNLAIEDNTIILNNGEASTDGSGVTSGTSGIEVDRGKSNGGVAGDQNARWIWDETTDSWSAEVLNGGTWETATITGNFSGSAVDFGFANTSLVRGDSSELAMGTENQVLTVGASDISYSYVTDVRSAAGDVVFGQGALNGTGGEYLEFAHEADAVYLTARNSAGTGNVDLYLAGQGNGDVIISQNASQQGLIIAENDTTLTVSGGNSAAADAGDAILKGGDGSTGFASGDVVLQGGTGGNAEGITIIKDSAGNEVSSFSGVPSATDYVNVENGVGEATISAVGDSTDVDLVLAPKGTGAILMPSGYSITTGDVDEAVANKSYVDSQVTNLANNVDPLIMRSTIGAGSSSATIGTLANIAGKEYYVSRITLHVTADFDVDHMVVVGDSVELAEEADSDVVAGTYVVDLPFAVATDGGSAIDVQFKDGAATAATPSTGSMIAVVEYKVL